ncbi:hypothetical protein IIA79_01465 [bacterium]|nr:hypothetical protein [bacterium]
MNLATKLARNTIYHLTNGLAPVFKLDTFQQQLSFERAIEQVLYKVARKQREADLAHFTEKGRGLNIRGVIESTPLITELDEE